MTKAKNHTFVAFLRGIGPGNPNMTNDKLREAFEALGYQNVRSVISSGNIIFETSHTAIETLEREIQSQLKSYLGITGGTIVRSAQAMRAFIEERPFGNREHNKATYLMVTFIKDKKAAASALAQKQGESFKIISFDTKVHAVCTVVNTESAKTPDFMRLLEKWYGKDITSRTWKTIERVAAKL